VLGEPVRVWAHTVHTVRDTVDLPKGCQAFVSKADAGYYLELEQPAATSSWSTR
jgi:hypothetical protein